MAEHDTDSPRRDGSRESKDTNLESTKDESEVDFEPEDEVGGMVALRAKVQKIKLELEHCKKENKEYLNGWQRCKADAINAKRETLQALERGAGGIQEALLLEIIPVLDSFDAASGGTAWEALDATWRRGMEHIHNQLLDVCRRHGVERYGKVGDMADHTLHDVVEERDDVPGLSGEIARIVRHGYRVGERVVRSAQVIVKK
ncbi:MAG TPA: nucleotide exchange factor GrpE [Candidatus Paceibacterota bacterium]